MKKNFPLRAPGKADPRVVEAVKNDVRKYVKRERRKALPEGFTLWAFQCRAGATAETAEACELGDISHRIDAVAQAGGDSVYIEIVAVAAQRTASGETPAGPE